MSAQNSQEVLLESKPSERKRTGRKKRADNPEQSQQVSSVLTGSKPSKQALLTNYCKRQQSSDTNSGTRSEEFLVNHTADRIKTLQEELKHKETVIAKLKADKEQAQSKTSQLAIEHNQMIIKSKDAIIKGTKQLAEARRKDKTKIDQKMGHFKDNNQTCFIEGEHLATLRQAIKTAQEIVNDCLKESKGVLPREVKENKISRAQFYKKELDELRKELQVREKEVENYKQRLKLGYREISCQLAKEGWPLLKNKYLPLELLGIGGFGEVYKCFDVDRLCEVALKLNVPNTRLSASMQDCFMKHLKRQIQTHKQLEHPNIVRVLDHLEWEGCLGLVMEYCSGPQLKRYIKKAKCLEERQARQIVKQLIYAVKYLHEQKMKVVHFDLKPANVLFSGGLIKVVDFGICKTIDSEDTRIQLTSPGVGTYWYLPPEVFDERKPQVSSKVDIWSIGVIFFEMLYGIKPFGEGCRQEKILRQRIILQANKVQFPSESPRHYYISPQAKEFIRLCLKYDADERLSPLEAYNHPYMTVLK